MIDSNSPEFVEALARGLSVLEAFDRHDPEMTLAELSRKVGMSIATVRRNVLTLEALGFIRRHNKHFLLAPRILTLGSAYLNAFNVEEAVTPELHRITTQFGDAANMAVLDGTNVLYIAHLSESRGVRRNASLGVTYPAYATSMGRVLLAALPDDEIERYFQAYNPIKLTDYTITDEAELRDILVETRNKGYSITVDQLDYGITAIAVPVKDSTGRIVCSINSSGYTPRLTPDELIAQRLPEMRLAANRLSQLFTRFPALLHSLAPTAAPGR
ncbi:helix-turn-helix domain-containing protein (plasmid) [Sinorhizobium sp. B11]|jgi:IclR family transcriptional regulator, pca regulon regulatory protein|uniref:IclR family transcriptional regulator domain-containing protein n=1 Tax=Rhizobium sp. BK512 TaxID=2587010 RepID=UPI000DDA1228|nr:IclR family transcriptional regulator C-terminal domain-containing protein [Rhizobium sp. BK512]MBB3562831.1 IclR family pca regulon transcriptional regulator [Rhizobium sp. BK512]